MSEFSVSNLRFLILSDPDMETVTLLAEKLVQKNPQYDCIIAIGPFVHDDKTDLKRSPEESAMAQADVASIIAQLENIVCRVVYLSSESDPIATLTNQLHLTPNSVNIHARQMSLADKLYIIGYTEKSESSNTMNIDELEIVDEEYHGKEKRTINNDSRTTIDILEELLTIDFTDEMNFDERTVEKYRESHPMKESSTISSTEKSFGMFVFNYRYAHSFSYFLFHMSPIVDHAGIKICIIPGGSAETSRLPSEFGNLHIIIPPSIREQKKFTSLVLSQSNNKWMKVSAVDICIDEL